MTKHSVQDLREEAAICRFYEKEDARLARLSMSTRLKGRLAEALEQLADEIEAHAETRKRLLRLQYRMRINADGYPIGMAQLAILTFWKRNTKEDINAARVNRKALHLAGLGVPR